MRYFLLLLLLGACFKKKKVEPAELIERDSGLITEEDLEELPER